MESGFFKAIAGFILGVCFTLVIINVIESSIFTTNSGRCVNVEVVNGKYISTIEFPTSNSGSLKIKVVGIYEVGSIVEVVPQCDTVPTTMEIPSPDEINVVNGTGTKK